MVRTRNPNFNTLIRIIYAKKILSFTQDFFYSETINKIKTNLTLPTEEDYEGAIVALHRLEDTYLLDPKDIKNGILSDKNPSRSLTGN